MHVKIFLLKSWAFLSRPCKVLNVNFLPNYTVYDLTKLYATPWPRELRRKSAEKYHSIWFNKSFSWFQQFSKWVVVYDWVLKFFGCHLRITPSKQIIIQIMLLALVCNLFLTWCLCYKHPKKFAQWNVSYHPIWSREFVCM